MIKIRASYETGAELAEIMTLIAPIMDKCTMKTTTKDKYNHIYITLKTPTISSEKP